jgi:hypothetical protein
MSGADIAPGSSRAARLDQRIRGKFHVTICDVAKSMTYRIPYGGSYLCWLDDLAMTNLMARDRQRLSKSLGESELAGAARDFGPLLEQKQPTAVVQSAGDPRLRPRSCPNQTYLLSLRGLTEEGNAPVDVTVSSSALHYCLRNEWGRNSLINGRFEDLENGDRSRFFRWFSIASANSHGINYDLAYYTTKLARPVFGRVIRGRASQCCGQPTLARWFASHVRPK